MYSDKYKTRKFLKYLRTWSPDCLKCWLKFESQKYLTGCLGDPVFEVFEISQLLIVVKIVLNMANGHGAVWESSKKDFDRRRNGIAGSVGSQ